MDELCFSTLASHFLHGGWLYLVVLFQMSLATCSCNFQQQQPKAALREILWSELGAAAAAWTWSTLGGHSLHILLNIWEKRIFFHMLWNDGNVLNIFELISRYIVLSIRMKWTLRIWSTDMREFHNSQQTNVKHSSQVTRQAEIRTRSCEKKTDDLDHIVDIRHRQQQDPATTRSTSDGSRHAAMIIRVKEKNRGWIMNRYLRRLANSLGSTVPGRSRNVDRIYNTSIALLT